MLRVFKPSSPMSLGTWSLTVYSLPLTLIVAIEAAQALGLLPSGSLALEWVRKSAVVCGLLPEANRGGHAMTDALLWYRIHFVFTITYHYVFPQLTMGLALFIVVFKSLALWRRDESYNEVARFWSRIFALNFAMGVVTGIPMEFQFGTNWSRFSRFSGEVVGQALAMEGVFAFFLESTFLGLFLFGERRLGARKHLAAAGSSSSRFSRTSTAVRPRHIRTIPWKQSGSRLCRPCSQSMRCSTASTSAWAPSIASSLEPTRSDGPCSRRSAPSGMAMRSG